MKRLILLACCALLLASCGGSWRWAKAGGTQAELDQDIKACNYESDRATAGNSNLDNYVIAGARVFRSCMEAKGYYKQPVQ